MSRISEIRFYLWVPDVQASIAFFSSLEIFGIEDISAVGPRALITYEAEKLRFIIEINQPLNDQQAIHVGDMKPTADSILDFEIENFDAFDKWHAKIQENSVQVSPILDLPYGVFASVVDPFGNIFGFSARNV